MLRAPREPAGAALTSSVVARTLLALVVASAIVFAGVPRFASAAFRRGLFERSTQTRRSRSQRRPTHGGVVVAVALALGALVAGPSRDVAQAIAAASVIAVATGWQAERGKGLAWLVPLGRVAVAAVLPLAGVRAGVTGSTAMDGVATAAGALALIYGLRSMARTDGTAALVAAASATGLCVIAAQAGDLTTPAAAALVGVSLAAAAHTWPPAIVRLGEVGPTVLGAGLAAVAVEITPRVGGAGSALVPVLALLPVLLAAVLPDWDRRLERRGINARLALPAAAALGAIAAERLANDALAAPAALALAVVPAAALAIAALGAGGSDAADEAHGRVPRPVLALVGALGLVVIVAGVLLVGVRRDMVVGRDAAILGLDAARSGDLPTARAHFARADDAFVRADRALGNPLVRIGDVLPAIGVNLRSARTLADVGRELSSTAVALAERAGADDLQVVDGRFPVEGARAVSQELGPALDTLRTSSARLATIDSPLVVAAIRSGTGEVVKAIANATDSIETAAVATRLLPDLLGADGDRRWMVAMLTPSEQRGAGGLAGDYAELRTRDGRISLVRTIPAGDLNGATDPAEQREALPAVYRARYGGFFPAQFWQNLSAVPDVPTFGEAVAAAYPLTDGGGPVDGFVTIDPSGLAALLELTGPVRVPDWPEPLTAANAAQVLLFDHYDRLGDATRDRFQASVVEAVVQALTSGSLPRPAELTATLAPAVIGGHLHLWSPDPEAQHLFERLGVDGAQGGPRSSDFVQLVTQNAGENKIDWYLRRSLTYEPVLDPSSGALTATATIDLVNDAPATGVSSYIIGEPGGPAAPGENRLRVTLFSRLEPLEVTDGDGNPVGVNIDLENGLWSVTALVRIPPGGTAQLQVQLAGAQESLDEYRLVVGRQPAVVPDDLQINLTTPRGWRVDPTTLTGVLKAPIRFTAEVEEP